MQNVGIPNLAEVDGNKIMRGGQPTDAGWAWLKAAGISTVIKLNTGAEATDDGAILQGMTVLYHPINFADQIIFHPDYDEVMHAVDAIEPHVFVHCSHGQDRTGLIIGCYRVFRQGWAKDLAYAEMLQHGFHPELLGLSLFWDYAVRAA